MLWMDGVACSGQVGRMKAFDSAERRGAKDLGGNICLSKNGGPLSSNPENSMMMTLSMLERHQSRFERIVFPILHSSL